MAFLLNGTAQGPAFTRQRSCAGPAPSCVRLPAARGARVVRRALEVPPSRVTAADELQSLSEVSVVVPDTLAFETVKPGASLAAASVSAATLRSVLQGQSLGLKPYENAINAALAAGRTDGSPLSAVTDPVDRAMANVGAMLADSVTGRVETIVDPRLANDEAALVAKARQLAATYDRLHVPRDRLVFGLPATWAGTQAAKTLEAEGIATSVYLVYGMTQGVAAMQAGASVVRVAVGRVQDWYDRNPGAIRNKQGPREDAGLPTDYSPGVELVKDLYCYGRRFHPKTKLMASSLRSRKDALQLAGLDFLVLSGRVMEQLAGESTDQGYNDGLSATSGSTGVEPALTPQLAAAAKDVEQWEPLTADTWQASLGVPDSDLLKTSLAQRARDFDELDKLLKARISSMT